MKRYVLLLALSAFILSVYCQPVTFQKTYGIVGDDRALSAKQTTDGGYIISGFSTNLGAGNQDVYLIKTDSNGDTLWTKTFGGISSEWGNSVLQTIDSGYIISGYTHSFGFLNSEVYLVKTDALGNLLWTKTFGTANQDYSYSIQQTTDAGYIITGYFDSSGSIGGNDVFLIKTDVNGDSLWTKSFGGMDNDEGQFVQQTTDGGYILTGTTSSFGAGTYDIYLIKTDSSGDTIWTKTFGGLNEDFGACIQQTTDGGYVVIGNTRSFGAGSTDIVLFKTDYNGNLIWTKTFGGGAGDMGVFVQQTTDGGYILTGYANGIISSDLYLIKTDTNGDTLWTKTFSGLGNVTGRSVQQTTDGGYIVAGFNDGGGSGNSDFYLIKTDANGNSGCNQNNMVTVVTSPLMTVTSPTTLVNSYSAIITTPVSTIISTGGMVTTLCTTVGIPPLSLAERSGVRLSPNPFSNKLTIISKTNQPLEITLFDITSRKLLQQQFTNSITLNTSHLSKGIYIYQLRNKNAVIKKGKVVKD
jgi:hypothetical protein